MSTRPVSISRLLDYLQGLGEQPAVNPARVKNGELPAFELPEPKVRAWLWALLSAVFLAAILWVVLFGPPVSGGFIYEQF